MLALHIQASILQFLQQRWRKGMSVPIWQLRIPSEKSIHDLVKKFADAIMESLEREIDFGEEGVESSMLALEQPLVSALFPYVKAYNACGRHLVCTSAVDSVTCPDYDDHIYILYLPYGTDGLVSEIVAKSLKTFRPLLDGQSYDDVQKRARASIFRVLRPHLYANPQCRNNDVCMIAHSVDPWPATTVRALQ
jgi:hypothetical protein